MKKNIVLALLIMATGLVLAGCASIIDAIVPAKAWDKSVPKDQMATLYYTDAVRVVSVSGEEKGGSEGVATSSGFGISVGPTVYQGKSQEHRTNNPKKVLRIPAGERSITLNFYQGGMGGLLDRSKDWTSNREVTFTFQPQRHYRVDVSFDQAAFEAAADAAVKELQEKGEVSLSEIADVSKRIRDENYTSEKLPLVINIVDITNEKGKPNKKK